MEDKCSLNKCIWRHKSLIALVGGLFSFLLYFLSDSFRALLGKYFLNRIFLGGSVVFVTFSLLIYVVIRRWEGPLGKEDYLLFISIVALATSLIAILNTL